MAVIHGYPQVDQDSLDPGVRKEGEPSRLDVEDTTGLGFGSIP